MKISKNFTIQEFVPKNVYEQFGDKSIWFIDPRMVQLAQYIRDYFARSMTINNWSTGGSFNYRGFRDDSFYANNKKGLFSQHRFGRAIDFNIDGMECDEIRNVFLANQNAWMDAGLTTIEHEKFSPTWVHIDIRTTSMKEILIVKP